jgi:hypothetical protein
MTTMKQNELKELYIKRINELIKRHKMPKHQAMSKVYKALIAEVTPMHANAMDAALHVAMVSTELSNMDGYGKNKKGKLG